MQKDEAEAFAEAFAEVTRHLVERFPGVPEDQISSVVDRERQRLAGGRIRDFLPLLAERAATEHLRTAKVGAAL